MKIRMWVEFKSDLPDDQVEEDGEILQFGGKNVAEVVGRILASLGCQVTEPQDEREQGWTFPVSLDRSQFWCQTTDLGDFFYLMVKPQPLDRFFNRRRSTDTHVKILKHLDAELRRDGRFRDLIWRTQQEMEMPEGSGGGAPHPVDD
jgi:hypothetical protein